MKINFKVGKRFYSDIFLNIVASGIVALLLQFIIYPLLNLDSSSEKFGDILVMMGIVNIIGVFLGNTLNNIRLILEKEYKDNHLSGDFSLILLVIACVNIFTMIGISSIFWRDNTFIENFILILISVFTMLRSYLLVEYRLKLDYRKIFYHSLIYSIALLLGSSVLIITDTWQLVFLTGEGISILYLIATTNLLREPIVITKKFKSTFKQYFVLCISSLIGNILIYLDRLIVFKLLGAHQVAVFFAATIIGKMSSFVLSPISGVVLSYISNKSRKLTLFEFWIINLGILTFSFVATCIAFLISTPILKILYTDLYLESKSILFIANLAVILFAASSITQSIVLKYSETYFQLVIQLFYAITYISGGMLMISDSGLEGLSIAAFFAAILKFLITLGIGTVSLREKNNAFR